MLTKKFILIGSTVGWLGLLPGCGQHDPSDTWLRGADAQILAGGQSDGGAKDRASSSPGEILWRADGQFSCDQSGRLFLVRHHPGALTELSRVDPATGQVAWNLRLDGRELSFDPGCSFADVLVIRDGEGWSGIDPVDGRSRWRRSFESVSGSRGGILLCDPEAGSVLLSHGPKFESLTSLQRATGAVLWSSRGGEYPWVFHAGPQDVLVVRYQETAHSLVSLSAEDGRERWVYSGSGFWPTMDEAGNLYVREAGSLARLDRATGRVLWTRALGEGSTCLTTDRGGPFVQEQGGLVRLDRESGKDLWRYDAGRLAGAHPLAAVLETGLIGVRSADHRTRDPGLVVLEPGTGEERFRRATESPEAYLASDGQGEIYLLADRRIERLSAQTGESRWGYDLAQGEGRRRLFDILDSDGRSLVVRVGSTGAIYPDMGLVDIDKGTGRTRWEHAFGRPVYRAGSDASRLFVNTVADEALVISR